ncbi:MAG: GNAT family N-acetyltransferase [bacterium]|nr:GNAT family N-acetyltransferase [bacterium]
MNRSPLPFGLEAVPSVEDVKAVRHGLAEYNAAFDVAPMTELAVFVRDEQGAIRGGAYGELGWGWLYIDLVWLDEARRGKGEGAHLLNSIEQAAIERGVENIWLATTSFQALPFYHHQGYRLFGRLEHRPPGYHYYYLQNQPRPFIGDWLPAVESPAPEDFNVLRQGLRDHAIGKGVKVDAQRLALFLRDEQGVVRGGLLGATYWGWLDVRTFWIDPDWRGHGYGAAMLRLAESEAIGRKCPNVVMEVADFQTTQFFTYHGYTSFAALSDRPPGHKTLFLKKHLR